MTKNEFVKIFIFPTNSNSTINSLERHRRLKEIFSEAICMLDETLVHVVVPAGQHTCYRVGGKRECF